MNLSRASLYALQALTYLAAQMPEASTPSHVLAPKVDVPEFFLVKVLARLVKAGILRSVRAPNGGYRLAKAAKDISLLEIIEAVDGTIRGEAPDISANGKPSSLTKQLAKTYDEAAKQIRKQLERVSLAGLMGKK